MSSKVNLKYTEAKQKTSKEVRQVEARNNSLAYPDFNIYSEKKNC